MGYLVAMEIRGIYVADIQGGGSKEQLWVTVKPFIQ